MKKLLLVVVLVGFASALLAQRTSEKPFDYESSLENGIKLIRLDDLYGYANSSNKIVIPVKYKNLSGFESGLAAATIDGKKWGYIDRNGKTVIDFKYDKVETLKNSDLISVKIKDKYGAIDRKGKEIIPVVYEILFYNKGLFFAAKTEDSYEGVLNDKGKEVVPFEYDELNPYYEDDLILALKNGLYGFINTKGKTVIPFSYDDGKNFSNGMVAVKKGGKWGYIDTKGKTVIDFQYKSAGTFKGGEAEVSTPNQEYFYINTKGQRLARGRWIYNFAKNDLWEKQFWSVSKTFPREIISNKWKENYYLTTLEYDLEKKEYVVIMSKSTYLSNQLYRSRKETSAIENVIDEIFKDKQYNEYTLTLNKWLNNEWFLISTRAPKGALGRKQSFSYYGNSYLDVLYGNNFPNSSVQEQYDKGLYITSLSYGNDLWSIIYANPPYYTGQKVRLYDYYPKSEMDEFISKNEFVTDIAYNGNKWTVVYTAMKKDARFKGQVIVTSDKLSTELIQEYWDKGYALRDLKYIER